MATQYTAGLSSGQVLTAATMNSIGAAWVDYTPTLTQATVVSKTVYIARYCQIQKTVIATIWITCTSSGTAGQIVNLGLPIAPKDSNVLMGSGFVYDSSTNFMYNLLPTAAGGTGVTFFYQDGNNFGASPAITLANNDQLRFTFIYEVA